MSANADEYQELFGSIGTDYSVMAKCACVACNSCTCACSCRVGSEEEIEW